MPACPQRAAKTLRDRGVPRKRCGIAKLAFYDDLSSFVSMKRAGLSAAASMIAKTFFLA
jgi:hypothetical protein